MGQRDLVKQIAFDNVVWPPFLYFPLFYLMKEITYRKSEGIDITPVPSISSALGRYKGTWYEDNVLVWKIWIIGDAFCFAVPTWLRMPSTHAISWIFNTCFSEMRGEVDAGQNSLPPFSGVRLKSCRT